MSDAAETVWARVLRAYTLVAAWIAASAGVIMWNKYILAYSGFPYPIALTMWHMFFCATLAFGLVKSGKVQAVEMSRGTYLRAIVPIGACYAGTLWVANAAYLYLSVSFIQMLKALMPVAVFSVGCAFGTEKFSWSTMLNMLLVTVGVAVASYGEINFNLTGVIYQLSSIVLESVRLVLVQMLLQSRGLKLNPVTTLYYVAPCCLAFLTLPFFALEYSSIAANTALTINPGLFLGNAVAAFALNVAVFLLVGQTSALTMNVAGVVKDWMLIGLSVAMFKSVVTRLNLGGYSIAFLAVCWYNHQKLQAMHKAGASLVSPPRSKAGSPSSDHGSPLLKPAKEDLEQHGA